MKALQDRMEQQKSEIEGLRAEQRQQETEMSEQIERLETECNDYKTNCERQDTIIMDNEGKMNELLQELYTKEMEMEKQRDLANKLTTQAIMKNNRNVFPLQSHRSDVDELRSVASSQHNEATPGKGSKLISGQRHGGTA